MLEQRFGAELSAMEKELVASQRETREAREKAALLEVELAAERAERLQKTEKIENLIVEQKEELANLVAKMEGQIAEVKARFRMQAQRERNQFQAELREALEVKYEEHNRELKEQAHGLSLRLREVMKAKNTATRTLQSKLASCEAKLTKINKEKRSKVPLATQYYSYHKVSVRQSKRLPQEGFS